MIKDGKLYYHLHVTDHSIFFFCLLNTLNNNQVAEHNLTRRGGGGGGHLLWVFIPGNKVMGSCTEVGRL